MTAERASALRPARVIKREPMRRRRLLQLALPPWVLGRPPKAGRISRYEIFPVRVPFAERVREAWIRSWERQKRDQIDFTMQLVRLHTDEGLSGIGESKMPREETEAALKKMVGRPAEEFDGDDSIRGILIAVYDLMGKAAGKPVAALLNPGYRRRITQTWWSQCFPPELMASEARLGASLGYRVHKVKARPWEDPVQQAAAMCAVVPKEFKIWVDANSSWETVERTLDLTRKLAEFDNYFAIESPLARANIDGYRRLKGRLPLKISEHVDAFTQSGELEIWTREKLLDAWIAGAPRLGRYVADLSAKAQAAGVPVWIEHSIDNGIAQVFQAHQTAAYAGLQYAISITHVLEDDLMKEPFAMREGYYSIPNQPGLGVTIDEEAVHRYAL